MNNPLEINRSRAWYHGGVSGLQPGDYLFPANTTGNWANSNRNNGLHRGRVYITSSIETAKAYAYGLSEDLGLGCVYRVDPEGTIGQDETDKPTPFKLLLGGSPEIRQFYCARAKVLYPVLFSSPEKREHREAEENKQIVSALLSFLFLPRKWHEPL